MNEKLPSKPLQFPPIFDPLRSTMSREEYEESTAAMALLYPFGDDHDKTMPGDDYIQFDEITPDRLTCILVDTDLVDLDAMLADEDTQSVQLHTTMAKMLDYLLRLHTLDQDDEEGVFDDDTERELVPIAEALEHTARKLRERLKRRLLR